MGERFYNRCQAKTVERVKGENQMITLFILFLFCKILVEIAMENDAKSREIHKEQEFQRKLTESIRKGQIRN